MKILYIGINKKMKDLKSWEDKPLDLTSIKTVIKDGIIKHFDNIEIIFPSDIFVDGRILYEKIGEFDLYLCDLTTSSPDVVYLAGLVEGMGKPIIYFSASGSRVVHSLRHKNILLYSEVSIEREFIDELNERIEKVRRDPSDFVFEAKSFVVKPKAFISYSHRDEKYFDRLLIHLKPLEKNRLIDIWDDTRIETGHIWKEEIDNALSEANIAILMVSADFMASDFIINDELPTLLSRAEAKGTKIVPVILSHCRFSRDPALSRFQAVNKPSEPLSELSEENREAIYDKIAAEIESALHNA